MREVTGLLIYILGIIGDYNGLTNSVNTTMVMSLMNSKIYIYSLLIFIIQFLM